MKCDKCNKDFPENQIQESHDVPCYLFPGIGRQEQKKYADKYGRHWLCVECHKFYEQYLKMCFREKAEEIANYYFKKEENEDGNKD